jgi:rod shape-determining protein MreB and related proteins
VLSALKPVVYIQIAPDLVILKNIKTGQTISEVPEMAISTGAKVIIRALGSQARIAAQEPLVNLINPFAHPRTLVSDFVMAEQFIKYQLRRVLDKSLLSIAPSIVMHPLGSPAGGFTQVERRAFREMAAGAGASEVYVWTGRSLTDQEIQSKKPPPSAGEWE